MHNVVGPRGNLGVIVPSTNTVVEAEYNWMRPEGVSIHAGRIFIQAPSLDSDETFEVFLEDLRAKLPAAIEELLTCKPDYLILGMSAETFWGGVEGNDRLEAAVKDMSGLGLSTGATSCRRALELLGARRIGVITPYQPIADAQVSSFFEEAGFSVQSIAGLKCDSATSIADVTAEEVRAAFMAVNREDVDALVQVGTNLATARVAAALESELSKPVLAINVCTFWHALRATGIHDHVPGFGQLLSDY